ncbi:MAG: molecular chaperone Hsp20 [Phycisphaerae bacterium]|nr:hypothetical protein [Phycisphaerales bacterium]MCK6477743.1 Hsp20/alpha crystallin family protein [Phycisphaerales bacterium]
MNSMIRSGPFVIPTFDRLLSQMLSDPFFNDRGSNQLAETDEGTLALDVSEDDKNIYVRASLPGFRKEDVHVAVHEGVLTINAQHQEEHEEKKERYFRRERRFGSLLRRVALPSNVQESQTTAQLTDGVLTLTLPKVPKDEPRRIAIK